MYKEAITIIISLMLILLLLQILSLTAIFIISAVIKKTRNRKFIIYEDPIISRQQYSKYKNKQNTLIKAKNILHCLIKIYYYIMSIMGIILVIIFHSVINTSN